MKKIKKIYIILASIMIMGLIGCARQSYTDEGTHVSQEPIAESSPISPPPPTQESISTPTEEPAPTPTPEPTPEPPPSFGMIDAHADTISRALQPQHNQGLHSNNLHVDFVRLWEFGAPVQVFALWLSDSQVADGFNQTVHMIDFFESEVARHSYMIELALDLDDILRIARSGRISAILAIEGGEALMGDINNLDYFFNRGVRMLGLTWNRENELGFGQATGPDRGLKPFGFEVIARMEELGMMIDVSHLNEAGFWDVHNHTTLPYLASHSNAYTIMPHNRNLRDDQIAAIVERGGLIGFNMFPSFVGASRYSTMDEVMAHFHHFINIGAGYNIGLGCDFDGIPRTPQGITDVSSLHRFRELLTEEFDEETSFRIMEGNFYQFFRRYFDAFNR
ncbi:MAG: dipeptidase [Oscillospiraceae bacterium]|nr:dipeptidase [Oscillospiraceae bacterium]